MRSNFKAIGIILIIQLSSIPHANGVIERDFSLTSNPTGPIVSMGFDAAGYSDWWDWGYHWPRHPYSAAEMLSGEWAGAVHYDGIASGNQAMWLTDWFQWANWEISLFPGREYGIISGRICREVCVRITSAKKSKKGRLPLCIRQ
jgi:hypothetical protein